MRLTRREFDHFLPGREQESRAVARPSARTRVGYIGLARTRSWMCTLAVCLRAKLGNAAVGIRRSSARAYPFVESA